MTWQKKDFNKIYKQGKNLVVLKRTPALHDLFLESASYGYHPYVHYIPRMNGVGFFAFDEKYKGKKEFLEDDRVKSVFDINIEDNEEFYEEWERVREVIFDNDVKERFNICSFYIKMIELIFEKYNPKETRPLLDQVFDDFAYLMLGENIDNIDEYLENVIFIGNPKKVTDISIFKSDLIKFINSSYLNEKNYEYINEENIRINEENYEGFAERFFSEIFIEDYTISEFCLSLEKYPNEVVMKSWSISTISAGVCYTFDEDDGYDLLEKNILVFLVISSRLIDNSFVKNIEHIPEFKKEESLPNDLMNVQNISELIDIIGTESLEKSSEILNESGIRPNKSKDRLVSAYVAGKDVIGWAWATRDFSISDEYSFDVVVLPKYSGLGLGKKLICDSIVYIVENAIKKERKGKFKVNVINPYLVSYLRKLGLDLSIDVTIKKGYRRNYLEADLKNSEQIEKILSNCC